MPAHALYIIRLKKQLSISEKHEASGAPWELWDAEEEAKRFGRGPKRGRRVLKRSPRRAKRDPRAAKSGPRVAKSGPRARTPPVTGLGCCCYAIV